MISRNFTPEQTLLDRLTFDDQTAIEELSRRYCYFLYSYCMSKLNSQEDSKRIARNIFISLWEDRHWLPLNFSLSLHLCKAVRKAVEQCINNKQIRERQFEQDVLNGVTLTEFQKAQWCIDTHPHKGEDRRSLLVTKSTNKEWAYCEDHACTAVND